MGNFIQVILEFKNLYTASVETNRYWVGDINLNDGDTANLYKSGL